MFLKHERKEAAINKSTTSKENKYGKMSKVFHILLVCTGNICRSSMAEALAKKILKDNFSDKFGRIRISSAGVSAVDGLPASRGAIDILKSRGIDLTSHRSRLVDTSMIERSDLILTMSQDQRERIKTLSPTSAAKVFTLKEFNLLRSGIPAEACHYDLDIADPGGGPPEVFEACVVELEEELKAMLEKI